MKVNTDLMKFLVSISILIETSFVSADEQNEASKPFFASCSGSNVLSLITQAGTDHNCPTNTVATTEAKKTSDFQKTSKSVLTDAIRQRIIEKLNAKISNVEKNIDCINSSLPDCKSRIHELNTSMSSQWPEMRIQILLLESKVKNYKNNSELSTRQHPYWGFESLSPASSELLKEANKRFKNQIDENLQKTGIPPKLIESGNYVENLLEESYKDPSYRKKLSDFQQQFKKNREAAQDKYNELVMNNPLLAFTKEWPLPSGHSLRDPLEKLNDKLKEQKHKIESGESNIDDLIGYTEIVNEVLKEDSSYCQIAEQIKSSQTKTKSNQDFFNHGFSLVTVIPCFVTGPVSSIACITGGVASAATTAIQANQVRKQQLEKGILNSQDSHFQEIKNSQHAIGFSAISVIPGLRQMTKEVQSANRAKVIQQELSTSAKTLQNEEAHLHNKAYSPPGKINIDKIDSLEDLKREYTTVNLATAEQNAEYIKKISENANKYEFYQLRYNPLKECNDHLLDKDSCTALGNLMGDIFRKNLNKLDSAKDEVLPYFSLKTMEVAVNKASTKMIEKVREAGEKSMQEWQELVKNKGWLEKVLAEGKASGSIKPDFQIPEKLKPEAWYTSAEAGSAKEITKTGDYLGKSGVRETRANDKHLSATQGSETGSPILSTKTSDRSWMAVKPELEKSASRALTQRTMLIESLKARNPKLVDDLFEIRRGIDGSSLSILKPSVYEVIRKMRRKEDISDMIRLIKSNTRKINEDTLMPISSGVELTEGEARLLQKYYNDLDIMTYSNRSATRVPPDASIFEKHGGFTFDIKGLGAENAQNAEVALLRNGQHSLESMMDDLGRLDAPTTKKLEDVTAAISVAANKTAKSLGTSVTKVTRSGDDIQLAFNRELSEPERQTFMRTMNEYLPEAGSKASGLRMSYVEKNTIGEAAQRVAATGENIEKATRLSLAESKYIGYQNHATFSVEMPLNHSPVLVVHPDTKLEKILKKLPKSEVKKMMESFNRAFQSAVDSKISNTSTNPSSSQVRWPDWLD